MSILDDIQNSLAEGGIYNSPDGKYSIIGGGDANTPGLPRVFAGAPRILVSGGGSANGVVPFEILSAFPLAPQGEQQNFAQQKATYEAGEGKAPTFGDAALAAVGSYFGGQALGGMLGGAGSTLPAGVGGIDSGSLSQILGNGAYGPGGAFATAAQTASNAYPYGMGPQGTGIGTGNPYMFAGEVQPGSLGTGTVNNLGYAPGAGGEGALTEYEFAANAGVGAPGATAAAASGIIPQLMAATGLTEKQLTGLGAAGLQSLASLYGARQVGRAATNAANIGVNAADRATALQTQMYQDQLSRSQPFYQTSVNALGPYTKGIMGSSEDQAAGRPGPLVRPFDPNKDYIQSPYYQFSLDKKLKDYTNKLAAMGRVDSGPMRRGVLDIASAAGQEDITNAYNRYNQDLNTQRTALGNLAGYGPPAAAVQNAASSTYATNVGNLGMGAASNRIDAGLAAERANQSAYTTAGNAFSNYLAPNPMNEFFQNQLNKRPVA